MSTEETPDWVLALARSASRASGDNPKQLGDIDGNAVSGWFLSTIQSRNGFDSSEEWGHEQRLALSDDGKLLLWQSAYQNDLATHGVDRWSSVTVKLAVTSDLLALDNDEDMVPDLSGDGKTIEMWGKRFGAQITPEKFDGIRAHLDTRIAAASLGDNDPQTIVS